MKIPNCSAELMIHADDPYCYAQFYCELPKGHLGSHVAHFEKAAPEGDVSNCATEARGTVSWQDEPDLTSIANDRD